MLAELMRFYHSIAISGTHGKTTTTSLVATLLAEGDLDPTYIIGGCLKSSNSHAKLGAGEYLVAEADESDASFAHLKPMISVVTNIDLDHMSTYDNNIEKLNSGFIEFLHNLPFYGLAIICIDDKGVKKIKHRIARSLITYGISEKADVRAENIEFKNTYTTFDVIRKNKTERLNIKINLPGLHNVQNTLAAIAVATELNVSNASIKKALKTFSGIDRRFQITENLPIKNGKVTLIDDYGHHPTEILATLNAIRSGWGDKKITLLFQPHRYTRTKDLFPDFVDALSMTDQLIVTKIYEAGEAPIKGCSGKSLVKKIKKEKNIDPIYINSLEDSINIINQVVNDGDILLLMGAGDIGSFAKDLPKLLRVAL
jgi:UDP-N-acetylmuramate--alanine ligase